MTNFELIKGFNENQMAEFINLYHPSCNEWCKDAESGCAFKCAHKNGEDIIRQWLDKDINDNEEI